MFVVLPFCQKDAPLARKHLAWAIHLDKRVDYQAILSYEMGVDYTGVLELAKQYFSSVAHITYDPYPGSPDWPQPQNWAFQSTCREVRALAKKDERFKQGWLWWESDAVPVRAGWLNDIATEFAQCGKPFMGHIHEITPGRPHMNGAGCYPWNVADYSQAALLARSVPWDVAARDEIAPKAANANHLFQHIWGDVTHNQALTFPDWKSVKSTVNLKGALFHRNKDGSLADRLLEKEKPTPAPPPPPTPEEIQRAETKKQRSQWFGNLFKDRRKREKWVDTPYFLRARRGMLIHCVEKHRCDDRDEYRRSVNAFMSWVEVYKTGKMIPAHLWEPHRTSEGLGDFRKLYYLKDILIEGLTLARDNDWIVLTNDDTILHPKVADMIHALPAGIEAASSFRIEFDKGSAVSTEMEPAKLAQLYNRDLGRDLFAFSAEWLREYWFEIPDFLHGEMEWDLVMALLIRDKLGIITDEDNILKPIPDVEMPLGYVLHERHPRKWQQASYNNPAKLWNKNLAKEWCKERGRSYPITAPKRAVLLEHPNGEAVGR